MVQGQVWRRSAYMMPVAGDVPRIHRMWGTQEPLGMRGTPGTNRSWETAWTPLARTKPGKHSSSRKSRTTLSDREPSVHTAAYGSIELLCASAPNQAKYKRRPMVGPTQPHTRRQQNLQTPEHNLTKASHEPKEAANVRLATGSLGHGAKRNAKPSSLVYLRNHNSYNIFFHRSSKPSLAGTSVFGRKQLP